MNQPAEDTKVEAEGHRESPARLDSRFALAIRFMLPVALLIAGGASYIWLSKVPPAPAKPPPKPKPVEVRVAELSRQDYQISLPTHGVIQAHNQAALTTQVAGRVDTIYPEFEVGAFFSEGDVLLDLNPVDFEEALANAKAQLALAQFNLEQEQNNARHDLI